MPQWPLLSFKCLSSCLMFNASRKLPTITFFLILNLSTIKKTYNPGTSLVVQWLRLHASIAGGMGSIPGQGAKIPHAVWHGQKQKQNRTKKTPRFLSQIWCQEVLQSCLLVPDRDSITKNKLTNHKILTITTNFSEHSLECKEFYLY